MVLSDEQNAGQAHRQAYGIADSAGESRAKTERPEIALPENDAGMWEWNLLTGMITLTKKWNTPDGSEHAEEVLEFDSWKSRLHPLDSERVLRALNNHLEGRDVFYRAEYRCKSEKGDYRWILGTGKVIDYTDDGKPLRMMGTHIDFTVACEKSLSEKYLKENLEKYSSIVNNANDGIYIRELDGTIIYANRKFAEIHELDPDEIRGRKSWEFLHPDVQQQVREAQEYDPTQGGRQIQSELMGITSNGKSVYLDVRTAPLIIQGRIQGIFGIIRDISERKEYERQLKEERDRANKANQSKSEFLANMSHEIRTPMNAILGFSEVLYQKLESDKHKKLVASVINSGNLLLSLLNDILDLSKIEAGRLEIIQHPTDLRTILNEIKMLFEERAAKKGIDIFLSYSTGFPERFMLDEIRIKQVIFNLVGNAIKFTTSGYVKLKIDFDALSQTHGELTIMVEDSGIGIPESEQAAIFESFRQQSGQSNRMYEGAGLGLAITKRLVEKMKGTISVVSLPGRGSLFTVNIPWVEFSVLDSGPPEKYEKDLVITFNKSNVMVVDDVRSNIDLVESYLVPAGLNIISADNGEIAIEMLSQIKPDLILLDMRMRGIDGYEVARRLKADESTAGIPVIAYTASVYGTAKLDSSGLFDDVLFKPVNRNRLLSSLTKYLPHHTSEEELPLNLVTEPTIDNIPEDILSQSPAILSLLVEKAVPVYESMKNQLVLFKIEELAEIIRQIALTYEFRYLEAYGSRLLTQVENLELDELKESLNYFPRLIELISLLKKSWGDE